MLGLLDDVQVVELTNSLAGAFCAKLLADQGAPTLKLEPPGRGDAARHEPPFLGDVPHPDRSALFLAFNTNKRGLTLDVTTPRGATCCCVCSPTGMCSSKALRRAIWPVWGWAMPHCMRSTLA